MVSQSPDPSIQKAEAGGTHSSPLDCWMRLFLKQNPLCFMLHVAKIKGIMMNKKLQ